MTQPDLNIYDQQPELYREIDYLIIGQGLSGTFLSYYLKKAGAKILVIDENKAYTASKVASGVINPVTGRRIVRTWRIEELLPFAAHAYSELGEELGVKILTNCSVLDFYPSQQMSEAFEKRLIEDPEYLKRTDHQPFEKLFNFNFNIGKIEATLLIDVNKLINGWRLKLERERLVLNESFNWDNCVVNNEGVFYKNYKALKVIDCSGAEGASNPYFKNLPYALNKGEAIIAKIPGLPADNIYKQGFSIVPWKDDMFWIGSSYEWTFNSNEPTEGFRQKVVSQLKLWLKLPFEIDDHMASVRPANLERRPFVGLHPQVNRVGILNGMGTKGCSLAPFFAKQLTELLLNGKPVYADSDVQRFTKILARKIE